MRTSTQTAAKTLNPTDYDLLKMAQNHKMHLQYDKAASTYRQLLKLYPHSQSASVAKIAFGQLLLSGLKQPQKAITQFNDYLKNHNNTNLKSAALAGLARSYFALKNYNKVITVTNEYIKNYKNSALAAEMYRKRGQARQLTGDCNRGIKDFKLIIKKWPDSKEAYRAKSGIKYCTDRHLD
jgi:TolA-binding protein